MKIKIGTYTGTGVAQDILLSFNPDVVITYGSNQSDHMFCTDKMPAGQAAYYINADGLIANTITIGIGKFTVGTSWEVNRSGETYYYMALGKDTANDLHTFTATMLGDSVDMTLSGFGFAPAYTVVKRASASLSFFKFAGMSGTKSFQFNTSGTVNTGIKSFTSDGLVFGSGLTATTDIIYGFALKAVAGKIEVGSYTASATPVDNTTINLVSGTLTPVYMLIRAEASAGPIIRYGTTGDASFLHTQGGTPATTPDYIQQMNAGNFQLGYNSTDPRVQVASALHWYLAIGDTVSEPTIVAITKNTEMTIACHAPTIRTSNPVTVKLRPIIAFISMGRLLSRTIAPDAAPAPVLATYGLPVGYSNVAASRGTKINLKIEQGKRFQWDFYLYDTLDEDTMLPVDITKYTTAKVQFRDSIGGNILFAGDHSAAIFIDHSNKRVSLIVGATISEAWTWRAAVYDIELIGSNSDEVLGVAKGTVRVNPEVTR